MLRKCGFQASITWSGMRLFKMCHLLCVRLADSRWNCPVSSWKTGFMTSQRCIALPSTMKQTNRFLKSILTSWKVQRHIKLDWPWHDSYISRYGPDNTNVTSCYWVQLFQQSLDLELHSRYKGNTSEETAFKVQHRMAKEHLAMLPLPEDRFLAAFSHIFAGGYAAGSLISPWASLTLVYRILLL